MSSDQQAPTLSQAILLPVQIYPYCKDFVNLTKRQSLLSVSVVKEAVKALPRKCVHKYFCEIINIPI